MYLVQIDLIRLCIVAAFFAAVVIVSDQYAIHRAEAGAAAILAEVQDHGDAFVVAILRAAIASQGAMTEGRRLNPDTCRMKEGRPLSAFTDDFADFRSQLGIHTQAAYEFYAVPGQLNPNLGNATPLWNSCGCLSLENLCYVDVNGTMSRAVFDQINGWKAEGTGWMDNTSFVHPRTYLMPMFAALVRSIPRRSQTTVPEGDEAGMWGLPFVLSLVEPTLGPSMVNLTLLPYGVCMERDNATDACVRATITEVRFDALIGSALRKVAASAASSHIGLYNVRQRKLLTAPSPTTEDNLNDPLVLEAIDLFVAQCSGMANASTLSCPQRFTRAADGYMYSAAFIQIGELNDLDMVLVDVTHLDAYYGDLYELRGASIIIACTVGFAILLLCILYFIAVTLPFLRLGGRIRGLAALRSDISVAVHGRLASESEFGAVTDRSSWTLVLPELTQLYFAFERLHVKIDALKRFVPEGVFVDTYKEGVPAAAAAAAAAGTTMPDQDDAAAHSPRHRQRASSTSSSIPIGPVAAGGRGIAASSPPATNHTSAKHRTGAAASLRVHTANRLHRRSCTLLLMGISLPTSVNLGELQATLSVLMDVLVPSTAEYGGTIESLRPERIVVVFGGEGRLSHPTAHASAAANCALDVLNSLPDFVRTLVFCVIDSGEYLRGSCGNQRRLSRVMFGPRLPLCIDLLRLSIVALGSHVLATERAATSLVRHAVFPVDCVHTLPSKAALDPLGNSTSTTAVVFELRAPELLTDIESGYPLERKRYRDGFAALLQGHWDTALQLLQDIRCEVLVGHAQRLIASCEALRTAPRQTSYYRLQEPIWQLFGVQDPAAEGAVAAQATGPVMTSSCCSLAGTLPPSEGHALALAVLRNSQPKAQAAPRSTTGKVATPTNNVTVTFTSSTERRPTALTQSSRTSGVSDSELLMEADMDATADSVAFPMAAQFPPPAGGSSRMSATHGAIPVGTTSSDCISMATVSTMAPYGPSRPIRADVPVRLVDQKGVEWMRSDRMLGHGEWRDSVIYSAISSQTGSLTAIKGIWLPDRVEEWIGLSQVRSGGESSSGSVPATGRCPEDALCCTSPVVSLAVSTGGSLAETKREAMWRSQWLDLVTLLRTQAEFQSVLRHDNILQVTGWMQPALHTANTAWFVLFCEHMSCGSIMSVQRKFGSVPFGSVRRYAFDMTRGLAYLHSLRDSEVQEAADLRAAVVNDALPLEMLLSGGGEPIEEASGDDTAMATVTVGEEHASAARYRVHGNLRPCNILVSYDGTCKLTDFGPFYATDHALRCLWWHTAAQTQQHGAPTPAPGPSASKQSKNRCPLVAYAAPELLLPFCEQRVREAHRATSTACSAASDVFSLGVVLYELVTKSLPWRIVDATGTVRPVPVDTMRSDGAFMRLRVGAWNSAQQYPTAAGGNAVVADVQCVVDAPLVERCVLDEQYRGHMVHFLAACMETDPQRRPTSQELLVHPLFL